MGGLSCRTSVICTHREESSRKAMPVATPLHGAGHHTYANLAQAITSLVGTSTYWGRPSETFATSGRSGNGLLANKRSK